MHFNFMHPDELEQLRAWGLTNLHWLTARQIDEMAHSVDYVSIVLSYVGTGAAYHRKRCAIRKPAPSMVYVLTYDSSEELAKWHPSFEQATMQILERTLQSGNFLGLQWLLPRIKILSEVPARPILFHD